MQITPTENVFIYKNFSTVVKSLVITVLRVKNGFVCVGWGSFLKKLNEQAHGWPPFHCGR